MQSLRVLEEHPVGIVFISILFIIWWYGVWGLLDQYVKHIHEKYKISYRTIYIVCFFSVVILIPIFPTLLTRF